jgi:hypothetical protein
MADKPHATFVEPANKVVHFSDGSTLRIVGWLDFDGDLYEGEDVNPETVRWCMAGEEGEDKTVLIDLKGSETTKHPGPRA